MGERDRQTDRSVETGSRRNNNKMLRLATVLLLWAFVTILATPVQRLDHYEQTLFKPEDNMTADEIILNRGYPVERHWVTTEDGYILQMHRIPYGKRSGPSPNKPAVFMLHGLVSSSSDWIITYNALSYALADAGYDVWLGNARGNTYSRHHVSLDPERDSSFWNFSFDEIGAIDVPAQLRYILRLNNQDKLSYIGHSQGTMSFWIAMETNPDLNEKIDLMFGLGPVAHITHMQTPIKYIAPYAREIKLALDVAGVHELLGSFKVKGDDIPSFLSLLPAELNLRNDKNDTYCLSILGPIGGALHEYENSDDICNHVPGGTSVANLLHFAQTYNTGKFSRYDYGTRGNLKRYHQKTPPEYDLSKVKAPVVLMWGQYDWFADPEDVAWLATQLPNLKENIRMDDDEFNHFDFIWGNHADQTCYNLIIQMLDQNVKNKNHS